MQSNEYFISVVVILILLLILKELFTVDVNTVSPEIVNKTQEKLVNNEKALVPNPMVKLPSETGLVEQYKKVLYKPDQPDYHPCDGDINTGSAPTEEVLIPSEFAYDYEPKYKRDMGALLGDS
jgi:hypothetical protein